MKKHFKLLLAILTVALCVAAIGLCACTITPETPEDTDKSKLTVTYEGLESDNEIEIRYIADEAAARYEEKNIVDAPKVVITVSDDFYTSANVGEINVSDDNSNVVAIIVVVAAVVIILALAAVAIVLIVKKKNADY